ncbi:hypothetical protein [Sediminibacter sp. Hel_I_10]|uniref:hypothetical protein n=1 Tax=Sediminibacter sp. Hel_I_10 TaxID=1392490 RepID=UPI000478B29E|nr:hypothetical protein [Sediminibacter sp. Hel_I_10]
MKNVLLIVMMLLGTLSYSQSPTKQAYRSFQSDWILSVGVNALGNLGTRNPVERIDDFALKNPLMVSIEHKWAKFLSIEQDFIFNGYEKNEFIDNGVLSDDVLYFSTNTNLKFYFSDYLYDATWVDLYVSGGVGIFTIDELNTSANVSGGVNFWINSNRTIGLKLQSTGKFAFNHPDRQFDNNHWIHSVQATFKL